jgi:Protein of unknwon function (DUF3310)
MSLSKAKVTSQRETEPNLLLSDPNIPPSTFVSSSRPTTGVPSSTSSGTPSGQPSTGLHGQSESGFPKSGSSESYGLKLPPEPPALNWEKPQEALAMLAEDVVTYGKSFARIEPGAVFWGGPAPASKASDVQVGGDHYRKYPIQPVEFCIANDIGFLAGNVIKYVTRYKDKNGAEDIRKAIHYLKLILEFEYGAT